MNITHLALALVAATILNVGCVDSVDREDVAVDFSPEVESESEQVAYPRWESVVTLTGDASDGVDLLIAEEALQWRSSWRCDGEGTELRVEVTDAGNTARTLTEASCPAEGESLSVETGSLKVGVEADGAWDLKIEQYVDTMLVEPPLPEMSDPTARVIGAGKFFGVEREGSGNVRLFEFDDGRLALRFEGFATLASPDLHLWVSEAPDVSTSDEALHAPHVSLGELTSTYGDQNYLLPESVGAAAVRSVVIWCEPMRIAYAAATLERAHGQLE